MLKKLEVLNSKSTGVPAEFLGLQVYFARELVHNHKDLRGAYLDSWQHMYLDSKREDQQVGR